MPLSATTGIVAAVSKIHVEQAGLAAAADESAGLIVVVQGGQAHINLDSLNLAAAADHAHILDGQVAGDL